MAKHMRKKHVGRKGKPLSAAHKKAISEGLKRYHRGGGKKKTKRKMRKHSTMHHATGHKRRVRRTKRK